MPVLESYRGRDIVGAEELAAVATTLIEQYGRDSAQPRVRQRVTARTVRQYLSESLLGEPTGQTGMSTVFNYGNLLRLLAVRKLLADHWSLLKIREFMRALDITALEELVNGALTSQNESKRAGEMESATLRRETVPLITSEEQESSTLFAVESARRRERELGEWVEIAPGLEIKVRRSFRPPASEEERARLAMRFWSVIMKEEE